MDDKYVGLLLALSSSVLIGTSFIVTKMGLMDCTKTQGAGAAGEHYNYLHNYKWWAGMITSECGEGICGWDGMGWHVPADRNMVRGGKICPVSNFRANIDLLLPVVLGEAANFAAYSYAPAILVTPLGAGSVLVGAVLASVFLKEELGIEGKIGCALCILGSVIIVLHSPEEKAIESVDEILEYVLQPGFILYILSVAVLSIWLIYKVAPVHGKQNMLVYIAICSLVGSISVMACKGFGIAIKLTFAGHNQLVYPSTYVFGITVIGCAVTQMNYFNKALDLFSTNRVTPIYYVFFTTATIIASVILFKGFNDTNTKDVVSMFSGFLTIFIGVFMVNSHKALVEAATASVTNLVDKGLIPGSRRTSTNRLTRGDSVGVGETLHMKTFDEESAPLRVAGDLDEDSDYER
ncbi:hypothetical protein HDV00_000171 [Rhizophlyctis rosea]|nr:hypothetical protein HDV00_000171 [Rhizophlyctis rosea]